MWSVRGTSSFFLFQENSTSPAPLLQEHLLEAAQTGLGEVVVNLEHATYIDSSGLGVLVSAHKRQATKGGELIVRFVAVALVEVV